MKSLTVSFLVSIFLISFPAVADLTGEGGALTNSQPETSSVSGANMPEAKITCILKAGGTPDVQADETAKGIYEAMQKLKLDGSKFTSTAMVHFLAHIKAESGAGANLTEGSKGVCGTSSNPDSANRGYGLIQVTGLDNLKEAEDCVNAAQRSPRIDIASNPENTVGNCAPNKTMPAMISLCWWKKNIMDNPENEKLERDPSGSASVMLTHVVNGGAVNSSLSAAADRSLDERTKGFDNMISKERTCGDSLVSSN